MPRSASARACRQEAELIRDEPSLRVRMIGYRDLLDWAGDGTRRLTVAAVTCGYRPLQVSSRARARLDRGTPDGSVITARDVEGRLCTVQRLRGYGENSSERSTLGRAVSCAQ
jgi:hypothetical protein